jgi:hypothetical protein
MLEGCNVETLRYFNVYDAVKLHKNTYNFPM